jgi:hypothetical protein
MKNNLTTGAWQHDIGCPISITLFSTSDERRRIQRVAIRRRITDERGGGGRHGWLLASGIGGGLLSMVLVRGMTKEVKGDMWVHRRRLGADGGGGGG